MSFLDLGMLQCTEIARYKHQRSSFFEEVLLYKLVSLEKVTKTILNRLGVWGGLSQPFFIGSSF
jgi:hypothetical protein